MKLRSSDDLSQLLHVGRLDVYDIKALVLNVEIPQIDPKIIAADEGFAITIHRNAVDVVCMRIRVRPPWNSSNDCIMVGHAR
jgi:hypothetical protein